MTPAKRKKTATKAVPAVAPRILSNGLAINEPSSFASRKRLFAEFTRKELYAESTKEKKPIDYAATFDPKSSVHYTWGPAFMEPVKAVETTRRHRGYRMLGKKSASWRFMHGNEQNSKAADIANSSNRSILLRWPLEVREKIYGYLLIQNRLIFLEPDWSTIRSSVTCNLSIIRVCKQIAQEAAQVLYSKNIFHVLLRETMKPTFTKLLIDQKFLLILKNVVVECPKESWHTEGCTKIAECVSKLVKSSVSLQCLTFVFAPDRINCTDKGNSDMKAKQATFADLLFTGSPNKECSPLMSVLEKLSCRVLNIVIRLPGKKRVLVSMKVQGLHVSQGNVDWFENDKVAKESRLLLRARIQAELGKLKGRVEAVVEDCEKAVAEGMGRLLNF